MTQTKNPIGYYQTIAELETMNTPDVAWFPDPEEYSEVISCSHITLKRLTINEARQ